jgi:hypothetical protein
MLITEARFWGGKGIFLQNINLIFYSLYELWKMSNWSFNLVKNNTASRHEIWGFHDNKNMDCNLVGYCCVPFSRIVVGDHEVGMIQFEQSDIFW